MANLTTTNINKKAMIEALEKSLGIVTTACKQVGISRVTHYEWMKEDKEYNNAVQSISEIALDFAESQLHKQISNGEISSTIFYLKTKGKKRGYIERVEQEVTVHKPIIIDWTENTTNTEAEGSTPSINE